MGQPRISDAWVGNTELAEILNTNVTNAGKTVALGAESQGAVRTTLPMEVLMKDKSIIGIRMPYEGRRMWMYRRDFVNDLKKEREANERARAADAKRRVTARTRAA